MACLGQAEAGPIPDRQAGASGDRPERAGGQSLRLVEGDDRHSERRDPGAGAFGREPGIDQHRDHFGPVDGADDPVVEQGVDPLAARLAGSRS